MPDSWETSNGLYPNYGSDASSDSDDDSLNAGQEFSADTSPKRKDSDGDTLPDGWEIANGRNLQLSNSLINPF